MVSHQSLTPVSKHGINSAPHVASSSHQHPSNPPGSSAPTAVRGAQSSNHREPINEDDIVIAVMGITRVGKSSFIDKAAGGKKIVITNNLVSQTRTVQPVRCPHPDGRRNVVLVDTPGFDDTYLSETQILKIIAHWLKETYQKNIMLSGLLYLHRISDNRVAGASRRDLAVFKDLCGKVNMKNVVLVTTMWDVEDESVGSEREGQLFSVFWKDMIRLGSRTCRFQGTLESAWEIIDCLDLERPGQRRTPLQIQQEMVDRGLPFHETLAAKALDRRPIHPAEKAKIFCTKLLNDVRWQTSPRGPSVGHDSNIASGIITPVDSTAESTLSVCKMYGRQGTLSVAIRVLELAHEMADMGNIPMLRGMIGTVLSMAQLIHEIGGTHHVIVQLIACSGWLLDETTQYAMRSVLSRDMKRALSSFQRELDNLEKAMTNILGRDGSARFILHEADLQTITAYIASVKTVSDKLDFKLAIDNRQAIPRLEDQLTALWASPEQRQCECGMSADSPGEEEENGQPPASTSQSS
ncbi:P-loop containing nucleoside triphosphate hydrolase protein [Boletus reticuloceps]|uniref:P-loop containing nucleoside triphosphate hydrolase protein n=1 Tax=Boletus reticuloceps TaxID=495285 RepID=A0A8I2YLM4_9AGAM|nr:P-loop containing nucleoside triphosphate hydrolase protein [Boletus reticuloceps]